MAAVRTLIRRCCLIGLACLSKPSLGAAGKPFIVVVASPDHYEFITTEQDLHPESKELYIGGLYDIRPRPIWNYTKGVSTRALLNRPIRLMMTHTPSYARPLLLVIDLSHPLPLAVWWDWAGRRVRIPAEIVADYDLSARMKRGRLQADGRFCLRP